MNIPFVSGFEEQLAAETRLSDVRGQSGELIVAGHRLEDWALSHTYVESAALLWGTAQGQVITFGKEWGQARLQAWQALQTLPQLLPLQRLQAALCLAPETADFATLSAWLGVALMLHLNPSAPEPDPEAEHIEDLLRMRYGAPPLATQVQALSRYLIAVSEHGLNASTFTARVITSTGASPVHALLGAIGALSGPLHGGAPGPVLDMLDAIGSREATLPWIDQRLAAGERIMGFGHRIYRTRDPRADVLKQALHDLQQGSPHARLQEAEAIESLILARLAEHKPGRVLATNVEFYTALLLDSLMFPREAFTAVFAVGRVLGWLGHIAEQRQYGRLIRPTSRYIGAAV